MGRKPSAKSLNGKAVRAAAEIEDAFEEPSVENAPPLPPIAASDGSEPSRATKRLAREMPTDLLQMQAWSYRVQMASMQSAMLDPKISESARRRELRSIAAAGAAVFPDAIRAAAIREIKEDRAALEAHARKRGGAVLEDRKPSTPLSEPMSIVVEDFGDAPS